MSYPALAWDPPDRHLEASGDSPTRRRERARRAAQDVLKDRNANERAAVRQLADRLQTLQASLKQRLLADGLTDFQRFNLTTLAADVDRMVAEASAAIAQDTSASYQRMVLLGQSSVDEPIDAAQLGVPALPGLASDLVTAAFDNTVDLLTTPMQQFGAQVKVALRRVALAGDNRFQAIVDLRDQIGGAGFDNAQYRAERIIRTELGRVFNEANYARLVGMAKEFPFLRKGWRAANDNRTRLGHREAARTYGRGNGIPIADLFQVQVHNERRGQAPVLIGTAQLRFPIDPQATPAGRIAAAATIMCRCNGFVDFDLADFAEYSAKQIQVAVGGPVAKPRPRAVRPQPQPTKPTPSGTPGLTKAVATKARYAPDGAAIGPKVVSQVPKQARVGQYGQGAMSAVNQKRMKRALDLIDGLHGDGNLPAVPATSMRRTFTKRGYLGGYVQARPEYGGKPVGFVYGSQALKDLPNMTVFHETGHFLDHVGFNTDATAFATEGDELFEEWRAAVKKTKAVQTLSNWRAGGPGTPMGVNQPQLNYMLSIKETWARSYAQWVATRTGDAAALRELRNMQAGSTVGSVPAGTPYGGAVLSGKPKPGTWDYPWQWDDEDFAEVGAAIDRIMEKIGWRKPKS